MHRWLGDNFPATVYSKILNVRKVISAGKAASHTYFSQRLRLHYLDWGNKRLPSLLLLHGIHDHCHTWDWTAEHLRDDFHVVAPDLRGHGDSEWSKGGSYSYLEYVGDIEQLVRQQELVPLTIVAHSMGGTIASFFAGLYPELVRRLVLIEPIGLYPDFTVSETVVKLQRWIEQNRQLAGRSPRKYESLEDAYARMQAANPHLSPQQASHLTIHGSNQNEDGTYSWKFDNYTRVRPAYEITRGDMIDLWSRIACPILIINSNQGYPHRIGQDGTLEHFRDVRLVEIEDAGHWTHHDKLDQLLSEVRAFLVRD